MGQPEERQGNILVVTGETSIPEILTPILSEQGYRLLVCSLGEAALEAARQDRCDVILIDSHLPDMDGYELCRHLRLDPDSRSIPILMVDPEDPHRALAAGAADYVRLGSPWEVLTRVKTHVSLARLARRLLARNALLEQERVTRLDLESQRDATQTVLDGGVCAVPLLIESLNDVIYGVDEQGLLTYVSPAIKSFLGYSPEEVIGRHASQFIHPLDLDKLHDNQQRVLAGRSIASEYRTVTKDGEIRWMRTSSQPALLDGRIVGLQGVLVDITARKQAEEQIRRQNELLRSVLDSLPHPFYVIRAADYAIDVANTTARAQGPSGQTTCYALTHNRALPCATIEHPCPLEQIKQTGKPLTVEHLHHDAMGNERHVEIHGYPLFDEKGNVERVIEYSLDITERVHAEEALRKSEKRYRTLLEALQEGIWLIDREAVTTFVNPRMAEMLGYAIDEMIGRHLFSFMDERGIEIAQHNLERRRRGIGEQHEFEFVRRDGSRLYALLETSPVLDDEGNYTGAIAGVLDITERRQAEEALRKSESLLQDTQKMARLGGWELNVQTQQVVWTEEVYRIHEVWHSFEPNLENALGLYLPEHRPILERAIQRAIETGEPWDLELELLTAKGRRLWVRTIGRAEAQDGQAVRLSGTVQDITDRKQTEQALLEAKGAAEQARQKERERRQEAEQRRQVAESLAGVVALLNSNQPLDQVLDHITHQAAQLLDSQAVAIYESREALDDTTVRATHGLPPAAGTINTQPLVHRALAEAVTSGRPVTVFDVRNPTPCEPDPDSDRIAPGAAESFPPGCKALLCVPITVNGRGFGGIVFYHDRPRQPSAEQIELATAFSNQIALAIENARLRDEVEQSAALAERSRLARDLHDSVTQALFSASLVAEVLPQIWKRNPDEAQQGLEELRILTRSALAEMRTLLLELRPTTLTETRLDELLWQLTEATTSRVQLTVTWNLEPVPALPADVHVTFYRVAQEALHNVVKHSSASQVTIGLRASPAFTTEQSDNWQGQVILHVRDNGRGFDPACIPPDRLGLSIMRERAEAVKCRLRVQSQIGQGTQVTLVWAAL
jgi:PAS domain S-box-containing protein